MGQMFNCTPAIRVEEGGTSFAACRPLCLFSGINGKIGGISMTINTTEFSETESVYEAHKARIEASRNDVPVSDIVDQIKTYAYKKIKESDAGYVKCSTNKDIDIVCRFIAATESISKSRVYPSLRLIGYNDRYHYIKTGGTNILKDRADLINRCALTLDENIISLASNDLRLFDNTKKTPYRIDKQDIAISVKDAGSYGIRTSDLNMYHVAHGLKRLVANEEIHTTLDEPYTALKESEYCNSVLSLLDKTESLIMWNNQMIEKMLE
jgi:hypothetical protein